MRFQFGFGTMALGVAALAAGLTAPASGQQYKQVIGNDLSRCAPGSAAAALITMTNVESSAGKLRVQAYRGTKQDWLVSGRWLNRIEVPARAGTVRVCMPLPGPGTYAIAVRHDVNGNGKTDIMKDGGGMSNNPSINVLNLGKPSHTKTRFTVGNEPTRMTINMRYM